MRMWMVDPKIMCRKHLLGEHVELHMIVGHMKKRRSIKGFIRHNCIEPLAIAQRHEELVKEMVIRGYDHKSVLDVPENLLEYLTAIEKRVRVSVESSVEDLITRCADCRSRLC